MKKLRAISNKKRSSRIAIFVWKNWGRAVYQAQLLLEATPREERLKK